jgi:hypothetical protein
MGAFADITGWRDGDRGSPPRGWRRLDGFRSRGGGRGGRGGFVLYGAVVVDIDDAPGAGDAAAAGGVEVGALAEVVFDGVDEGDGEGLGLGVEGGELALLGVGVDDTAAKAAAVSIAAGAIPLVPGAVEVLGFPAGSFFTGDTASGTSVVYVTPGEGM